MEMQTQQINKLIFKIDVNTLLNVVKTLRELTAEARIKINRDGLKIIEMSPDSVSMVSIDINRNQFIELIEETEIKEYGINTEDLYKILKENKKQYVKVISEENKLIFIFDNGLKSEISLIEIETENKNIPEMDFNTEITINSKRLKEIIKHFNSISEGCIFETDKNNFKVYGGDINKSEIVLNDEVSIKGNDNKGKYSTEYLSRFIKVLFSEDTILKFNTDYPLLLEQKTNNIKVSYLLAPKIETD